MLTSDNAWWCAGVLAALAAICIIAVHLSPERTEDWSAPCDDTPDPADHACNIPAVIWSDTVSPGTYVCAVPAENMPRGICGWPVTPDRDCPAHGTRAPHLNPAGVQGDDDTDPDAAYETPDTTHHDYWAGGPR